MVDLEIDQFEEVGHAGGASRCDQTEEGSQ